MDNPVFFMAKIRKKQTLCRPNRAAVIPPQSPRGGRSGSARGSHHHKPLFFEKRLSRGRIPCFDFYEHHCASQNFAPMRVFWANRATGKGGLTI